MNITGSDPVNISANGGNGTLTINGDEFSNDLTLSTVDVETVSISMLGGDDRVDIKDATGLSSFTLDGGDNAPVTSTTYGDTVVVSNISLGLYQVFRGITGVETADINLYDLVTIKGSFEIVEESGQELALWNISSDEEETGVIANLLSISLNNVTAFAGYNKIGLNLDAIDLAIALWSEVVPSGTPRNWTSVIGVVGTAALLIPGLNSPTLTDVQIQINKAANGETVVDYSATSLPASITAPFSNLDKRDYLQVVGTISNLDLFGFVTLSGNFAVENSTGQHPVLSDTSKNPISANLLTIALNQVDTFLGYNGVGLDLDAIDLAIALWSEVLAESSTEMPRSWTSVIGLVGTAALFIPGINPPTLTGVQVQINNKATRSDGTSDGTVVDYSATTLPTSITAPFSDLDTADYIQVAGQIDIDLFGVAKLLGGFAVRKDASRTITITGDATVTANLLTIALANANAFLGYDQNDADATNDIGLLLNSVNLAIALWSEVLSEGSTETPRNWTSIMGQVGSASFRGIDGLQLDLADPTLVDPGLEIQINKAATGGTVVNYAKTNLQVTVAPGEIVTFDMNGSTSEFLRVAGNAVINLFDVVKLTGRFEITRQTGKTISLTKPDDSSGTATATLLSIIFTNVTAFFGYDGIGLTMSGVNLAMAFWGEQVTSLYVFKGSGTKVAIY